MKIEPKRYESVMYPTFIL
jgi:serine/threonine protein phosphatase PrpC